MKMRMRRVKLESVACPTLPYFSTLSHKMPDFKKMALLNIQGLAEIPDDFATQL